MEKHSQIKKLKVTPEALRWATPEIIADYRAQRLKCKLLADLGCGLGFQAFSFAKFCEKVIAVEKDPQKLKLAQENAKILGLKNIEFIEGDILDEKVIKKLKGVETIFCDPSRLPEEKERKITTILPSIPQLLEKYSLITFKIALEFPPQIKEIPFDCEKEYLSLNGELNRLTLYFGGLKRSERSAVVLPAGEILRAGKEAVLKKTKKLGTYLYEVDPAVVKAELLGELSQKTGALYYSKEKAVFSTSNKKIKSPFFKNLFKVLGTTVFEEKRILDLLKTQGAGKVTLRFRLKPEEYWKIRNRWEKPLKGTKVVSVFRLGKEAIIAEKVRD